MARRPVRSRRLRAAASARVATRPRRRGSAATRSERLPTAGDQPHGLTLFTIGHSTRTAEELLSILRRHGIERLVDVRAFPGSRRHPHFGRDALRSSLAAAGIEYSHAPELGGRRKPRPDAPPSAWRNASFAAYADYMTTPAFREAVDRLLQLARQCATTIMCSEAVPWRCHRSMISDAVVARGHEVTHILGTAVSRHSLSPIAVVHGREVRYPPPSAAQAALPLTGL